MKTIILAFVLFLSTICLSAQEWSVGPRLGMNLAHITNSPGESYTVGVNAGAFGEYRIRNWAVEGDLLYSLQGQGSYDGFGGGKHDHYLLVPVKLKYYLPFATKGFNIFAGPQLDICLKRNTLEFNGDAPSIGIPSGNMYSYRTVMASATIGIGYRFRCGLNLTANYNVGLTSHLKNENSFYNSVFQIAIGWNLMK